MPICARGLGYVAGGLAGVELLEAGAVAASKQWAYGTKYGALILFTGISSLIGGWATVWKVGARVKSRVQGSSCISSTC